MVLLFLIFKMINYNQTLNMLAFLRSLGFFKPLKFKIKEKNQFLNTVDSMQSLILNYYSFFKLQTMTRKYLIFFCFVCY